MKLGIRGKLFLITFGLIVLSLLVAYGYLRQELENEVTSAVRSELAVRARLVAHEASEFTRAPDDLAAWDALADELGRRADTRVTLIRRDGVVMGDSEVSLERLPSVENHGRRAEVLSALRSGYGESQRLSATIDRRLLYVAVPYRRGDEIIGVSRVALPLTRFDAILERLHRVLAIGLLIALAVAAAVSSMAAQLASRTARSLTAVARRMADGDLGARIATTPDDEFGTLGRALDALAKNLSATLNELRKERDLLGGILTGMQEGVLLLDADGRAALVNPALREMLLLRGDPIGKTPLEIIRHAELKELIDTVRRDGQSRAREIEISGLKPRRLLVQVAPLESGQGSFAVFVDVTEMRRLESLRRDFVANVSHELRTPVTAVRSAAETLAGALQDDPPAARQFVEIIERNAARLQHLVEDLLDLSRIESHELKLAFEPIEIAPIYEQVESLFHERAERKRIRLLVDQPLTERAVTADRRALEHVLSNLVDNAVKYCSAGSEVRLTTSTNGSGVRLEVRDTGPGIEQRHLPRLFERFYRVDAGRSRDLGGTGLGLAIVKHLVESMHGNVSVESEFGRGTTFSVVLPRAALGGVEGSRG